MATTHPLDEQIVAILTKPCTSDEAAAVRGAAEKALADANAEADAADVASLSPLATDAQAGQLRQRSNDLHFSADRLEARVSALSTRVAELQEQERKSIASAEFDAAIAERDALAADIRAQYPAIVGQMTSLTKRIAESDARCARAGIRESAEAIGRDVPAHFRTALSPVMRFAEVVLPMPTGERSAWEHSFQGTRWNGLALLDAE